MQVTNTPRTDHRLLDRIRDSQDREAWDEFVIVYRPLIYRVGRRHGLQDADAQNLVQEVLRKVAEKIADHLECQSTDAGGSFRRWLTTVARNTAIDSIRRVKPDAALGGSDVIRQLHELKDDQASHEILLSELRREAFRWAARRIRDEFTEGTWLAFWHTMVDGKTCKSVADEVGKSVGAIYTARSRVMQRLRKEVAKFDWESNEANQEDKR